MDVRTLCSKATAQLRNKGISQPSLETEVLLGFVLGQGRAWLLAHGEACVPAPAVRRFRKLLRRRLRFEPVSYLIGTQEFYGRDFRVSRSVLIPRPKTELMIEEALRVIPLNSRKVVADLGTGSGNIAITLALERPHIRVVATDLSQRALAVAQRNARQHNVVRQVQFLHGDMLAPLSNRAIDVLLANLPYVPSVRRARTPDERAAEYEPAMARYGTQRNRTGRALLHRFFRELRSWKRKPRAVLVELGRGQYEPVRSTARATVPEYRWSLCSPYAGTARILIGERLR